MVSIRMFVSVAELGGEVSGIHGSSCVAPSCVADPMVGAGTGVELVTSVTPGSLGNGGKNHFGSFAGAILSVVGTGVVCKGSALGKGNCTFGVFGSILENSGATACCTA